MPTKTIYVSDDDIKTFEQAKKLAGKNLSAIIVESLKDFIERQKSENDRYEEVRFVTGAHGENGEKRFWGKLILEWRGYDEKSKQILSVKTYRTRRNQIAATVEYRNPIENMWNNTPNHTFHPAVWGVTRKLFVAKNVSEFANVLPADVARAIVDAAKNDQTPVEFLDI